jgi:hypothetical protein
MATYTVQNGLLTVLGQKLDRYQRPVVGAYVQLVYASTSSVLGNTTTDERGYWSITLAEDSVLSGKYEIHFIGSNMRQSLTPTGDWELLDILGYDLFDPIEPADIQGLLREVITVIDSNTVLVEYAVAINATRVSISNIAASGVVNSVQLTKIEQHKDAHIATENFDPAYDITQWTETPAEPYNLAAGETIIYDLSPVIISGAYKVRIDGVNIGSPDLLIKITSRLAADEIDAGRIRIEKGISISKDGTAGFAIDTQSLRGVTASGLTVVALYNDPQTIGTLADVYASLGGWAITETSLVRQVVGTKIEIAGTSTPFIAVGNGTTEYARMGYLDGSNVGWWGSVGGIGGTSFASSPVRLTSEGLVIKDNGNTERAYFHVPATDDWKIPDVVQKTTGGDSRYEMLYTGGSAPTYWTASGILGGITFTQGEGDGQGYYNDYGMVDGHSTTATVVYGQGYWLLDVPISGGGAGTFITFKCWAKRDATGNANCRIQLRQGGNILASVFPELTGAYPAYEKLGTWQNVLLSAVMVSSDPVTIEIYTSGSVLGGNKFTFDSVAIFTEEYFTQVSDKGIYVFRSSAAYMKVGDDAAEFVFPNVQFSNLTVTGALVVTGDFITSGPSIQVNPIHILNDGGLLPNYAGLEIHAAANNPLLFYNDSRWKWGNRASGSEGDSNTDPGTLYDLLSTQEGTIVAGDMYYAGSTTSTLSRIPKGSLGQVLVASTGLPTPAWSNTLGTTASTIAVAGALTTNNVAVATTHDMDMEFMKLNFQQVSWSQFAVFDAFDNSNKRDPAEPGTYHATLALNELTNGGDTTPNREFMFYSKDYPDMTVVYSGIGVGTVNTMTDSSAAWFTGENINLTLQDSSLSTYTVTASNTTQLTVSGTPSSGYYTLYDVNPTYFFGFLSFIAYNYGGTGYVKFEFSTDGGSTYGVILDTYNSINRLAAALKLSTYGMTTGSTYKVRLTLKNDGSGNGPKVYRFLVATDPSPWRY